MVRRGMRREGGEEREGRMAYMDLVTPPSEVAEGVYREANVCLECQRVHSTRVHTLQSSQLLLMLLHQISQPERSKGGREGVGVSFSSCIESINFNRRYTFGGGEWTHQTTIVHNFARHDISNYCKVIWYRCMW